MISGVRIKCFGISNGFRTPLSQSVQDTLPLPTPTQLIGLLGAAAGIPRSAMPGIYSKFKVGIMGTHATTYQDLTKIVKYAARGKIKNPQNPTSLLIRENLFNSEFIIWYLPVADISVSQTLEFFQNPKYALSLGRDDEIVRIDEVRVVNFKEVENAVIHDTVVPFAMDPRSEKIIDSGDIMIPLVPIELPRSFTVNSNNVRNPMDFKEYTFVEGYKVQTTRNGALDDEGRQFFPL